MGETVGNIAKVVTSPISAAAGAVGNAIGGPTGGAIAGFGANPAGFLMGSQLSGLINPQEAPGAPGTDASLAMMHQQQLAYAKNFQENLPQTQQKVAQQLTNASNQTMNAQVRQVKNQNNARGLTYSGVNQGQQQAVRSNAQQQLAGGISAANANLENASNTLNAQAVETGVGIQQTQQAIQNQIFQQQMSQMQSQNSIFGSALGTGILAATLA